jgi:hypothetical protein
MRNASAMRNTRHDQLDVFGTATASSTSEPCLLSPQCGPLPLNNNVRARRPAFLFSMAKPHARSIDQRRLSAWLNCLVGASQVPQVDVRGDDIFVVGGEVDPRTICGDEYGHYPTLALHGKITKL